MTSLHNSIKQLKEGRVNPIYLLYGTERYFVEQFKKTIIHSITKDNDDEAIISYDLLETPIQDVITDVETIPFFSDRKIIFAENALFFKAKPEKLQITHDLTALETYINQPIEFSILVLIAPYEKLDERKKITKQMKKQATVIDCNSIQNKQLTAWIHQIANDKKIQLTDEACELLEAEFQNQLHLLENELEKLAHFVGDGGEVTKEIATNLISTSLTHDALELVDAVLKQDLLRSIKIYKELEKKKEEPIGLIALLAYQFRIIFQVKLLKQKGYPNQRIQSELKVHPYVVRLASQRSSTFNERMLKMIMNELTETDAMIKQGKINKEIAFELLLYKLTTVR